MSMNEIETARLLARAEGLLVEVLKDRVDDQWRQEAKRVLLQSDEYFGDAVNRRIYPDLFPEVPDE